MYAWGANCAVGEPAIVRVEAVHVIPSGRVVGESAWLTAPSPPAASGRMMGVVAEFTSHSLLSTRAAPKLGAVSLTRCDESLDMAWSPREGAAVSG